MDGLLGYVARVHIRYLGQHLNSGPCSFYPQPSCTTKLAIPAQRIWLKGDSFEKIQSGGGNPTRSHSHAQGITLQPFPTHTLTRTYTNAAIELERENIRVRFRNGCNRVPWAREWKGVECFGFGSWSSCSVTGF